MKEIVFGGTFDRLHKGHKEAIKTAFSFNTNVSLGVSAPELVKGKTLSKTIQPYTQRVQEIKEFLKQKGLVGFELKQLNRAEGDAETNQNYTAIIVTKQTKPTVEKINGERRRNGLKELIQIEVPLVLAEDGKPISSSRIRAGVIDREGNVLEKEPVGNKKRENIMKILQEGPEYGYQIHKKYNNQFGKISLRLLYYHLAKGVEEGLFEIAETRSQPGGYSWGKNSERVYYTLGAKGK